MKILTKHFSSGSRYFILSSKYIPQPYFMYVWPNLRIRDSAVGITTGYGLDDREVGVRVPVGSRIFSSPCRPDRLWGPPGLLSSGYRG
jgi:hypothetical protein